MSENVEKATLGGGCFWCLESIYKEVKGVHEVVSGYAGGHTANPTYEDLHHNDTGHAEVVQITFDPKIISYKQILEIFWHIHDPTTPNQQGNDIGPEYRSMILYHDDNQREVAEKSKAAIEASGEYTDPIVTEIVPLKGFYKAEDYHQNYYADNKNAPYCRFVISPKLAKFRQKFKDLLQPQL